MTSTLTLARYHRGREKPQQDFQRCRRQEHLSQRLLLPPHFMCYRLFFASIGSKTLGNDSETIWTLRDLHQCQLRHQKSDPLRLAEVTNSRRHREQTASPSCCGLWHRGEGGGRGGAGKLCPETRPLQTQCLGDQETERLHAIQGTRSNPQNTYV